MKYGPMAEPVLIQRDEVPVMFKRVADEPEAIKRGMAEVEELVGLRGRKYYGAFDMDGDEYRVCVQLQPGDDPDALELEVGTLPGGRYARVRLSGEPPDVYNLIGPTFEALAKRADRDPLRPGIEFYRRRDVIDLLLPVDDVGSQGASGAPAMSPFL
jgi:effector-binding domain-containing protein